MMIELILDYKINALGRGTCVYAFEKKVLGCNLTRNSLVKASTSPQFIVFYTRTGKVENLPISRKIDI